MVMPHGVLKQCKVRVLAEEQHGSLAAASEELRAHSTQALVRMKWMEIEVPEETNTSYLQTLGGGAWPNS